MSMSGRGNEADRTQVQLDQKHRWDFLFHLYKEHRSMREGHVQSLPAFAVGQALGIESKRDIERVFTYLKDAGLIKYMSMGPNVGITKLGIDAVEEALSEPEQRSRFFAPVHQINIWGDVHGSAIQQGTTQSTQTIDNSSSVDWDGLRAILADLRPSLESLPIEERAEAMAVVDAVDAQARLPKPTAAIVKVCLGSLRAILANTAGNIAAAPLIQWMQAHHWLFN